MKLPGLAGSWSIQEAVPRLINLVEEDSDVEVQEMAIWAMGRIGGQLAREALELCLDNETEVLTLAAEDALDELNLFAGSLDLFDFDEDDFEDYFELDDDRPRETATDSAPR